MTTRQAAELYKNMGKQPPAELADTKVSKYGARKKEIDGHMFDSTSEALAYQVLKRWEAAGEISNLELQPQFPLQEKFSFTDEEGKMRKVRARSYVGDFKFLSRRPDYLPDRWKVVDVKGVRTAVYSLKLALFRKQYPQYIFEEWSPQKVKELARR